MGQKNSITSVVVLASLGETSFWKCPKLKVDNSHNVHPKKFLGICPGQKRANWLPLCTSCPVLCDAKESYHIIYLHKEFACIRSMMSWRLPLLGPHSLSTGPSEAAGGPKNRPKEPSLRRHNGSSCEAFGKSVTTKEHSRLSQAPALCPPASRRWGGGGREKGKEYVWLAN